MQTFKLSPEALAKAVNELNEPQDQSLRLAAINTLRDAFISENPDLKLVREDDAFMLRFLRAKKFDHATALVTLKNYHTQRLEWPEVFDKVRNPILVKSVFEKGAICPLEVKAKNGASVVLMRPGFDGCTEFTDMFAGLYLALDRLLENEETQIYGVVFINDLAYFSTEIAKQMNPALAMRVSKIMQEGIPLRVKGLNLTNEPRIFDAVFAIIQPFLKAKIKKRVIFHGKDFSRLYGIIDKSVLPFMFAGSGPDPDAKLWKDRIIQEGTAL